MFYKKRQIRQSKLKGWDWLFLKRKTGEDARRWMSGAQQGAV